MIGASRRGELELLEVELQPPSCPMGPLCRRVLADPDVLRDMETFMRDLAPDGDPRFVHTAEGPDDMAAHVRTVMTQSSLTIPVSGGRLALGTWQGIFLWEHRLRPHRRRVVVTIQ